MCQASKADNYKMSHHQLRAKEREGKIFLLGPDRWEWTWLQAWNKWQDDKVEWIMQYWSVSRNIISWDKIGVLLWWVGKSDNCVSYWGVCLWSGLLFYVMLAGCSLVSNQNFLFVLLWTDRWKSNRQLVDVSGGPQLEIPKPIDT